MIKKKKEWNKIKAREKKQEDYSICEYYEVYKYALKEDFEVERIQFINKFLIFLRHLLLVNDLGFQNLVLG